MFYRGTFRDSKELTFSQKKTLFRILSGKSVKMVYRGNFYDLQCSATVNHSGI